MEFSPFNKVVKLCILGMDAEEKGNLEEAASLFLQAWNEATDDFERFLGAFYVARQQQHVSAKLDWLEIALHSVLKIEDSTTRSVFPALYSGIAKCWEDLGNTAEAEKNYALSESFRHRVSDPGPFYHGTKADLHMGDLLYAGHTSNYDAELKMKHIYFTASLNGAGLAAAVAAGDAPERVYMVEPTAEFEHDPNLTDKKFPGNPTRSYRSAAPLKIVAEVSEWMKPAPEQMEAWRKRLAENKGEIIN
jgi:hypothetical protein